MGNQVEIICKNNGKTLLVDEGTALIDIYKTAGVELPYQVLCAQVNNRTRDLSYRVYQPKQIMFSDASHIMGMRMYVRSLYTKRLPNCFRGHVSASNIRSRTVISVASINGKKYPMTP